MYYVCYGYLFIEPLYTMNTDIYICKGGTYSPFPPTPPFLGGNSPLVQFFAPSRAHFPYFSLSLSPFSFTLRNKLNQIFHITLYPWKFLKWIHMDACMHVSFSFRE